jgi:hypothetical protein
VSMGLTAHFSWKLLLARSDTLSARTSNNMHNERLAMELSAQRVKHGENTRWRQVLISLSGDAVVTLLGC